MSELIQIGVQVNGKLRCALSVEKDTPSDKVIKLAKENENVKKFLNNEIIKEVYKPNFLLNIITKR